MNTQHVGSDPADILVDILASAVSEHSLGIVIIINC